MPDWIISIPFREESDSLAEVGALANTLPAEERDVVREVVAAAAAVGVRTAGELCAVLDEVPQNRRGILDGARPNVGLPSVDRAEAAERWEAAQRYSPRPAPRDHLGRVPSVCGVPDCPNFERDLTEPDGVGKTRARFWTCDEHRALGDFSPPQERLAYAPGGGLVDLDAEAIEAARERARQASKRAQTEAEREERRADGERRRAKRQAEHERRQREAPPGVVVP
jgi:hypothetical protein